MPDYFTSIGTLLDGSFLQSGALWALSTIPGFPPIIQTVHILGIAVVMGSVVGFIAMAIILPIFKMSSIVSG